MSLHVWAWYGGAFIVALAVLVVVHELGHFLAARACDVKVLRFAFGFGRTLYSRRAGRDGTEWAVCAFPLGGYVKMLDEREGPVAADERHRAFNAKPLRQRAFIVGSFDSSGSISLIASVEPVRTWIPRYTRPIPPAAITESIR